MNAKDSKINIITGLITMMTIICVCVYFIKWIFGVIVKAIINISKYVNNFVSTTDQVIVVAMITGAVSIVGVVISSIVAKIVEYKYNVKRYLYDKREEPYK